MRVLVVGSGGRERALVWKLEQSLDAEVLSTPWTNEQAVVDFVRQERVDFVVVGPDGALADGLVDRLNKESILAFGPTKAAAKIEWSKGYAKQLMIEEGIPTATHQSFSDLAAAREYIKSQTFPLVIKADGLAAGKGVVIAQTLDEALAALDTVGMPIVIEEYMVGREISVHAICDGERAVLFPPARDHKRIFDGEKGPNTGGMGTIAPVPWVSDKNMKDIEEKVVRPILAALKKRGTPFAGLLFPGIMLTDSGPKVIEFNARFGDPETQSYMRLLESDLLPALVAAARGDISGTKLEWRAGAAATIVLATRGYPGIAEALAAPLDTSEAEGSDVVCFVSGVKGRVVGVTATGTDLPDALQKAYGAVAKIKFDGMQYRTDIGTVY